jgi:hypothetical protein
VRGRHSRRPPPLLLGGIDGWRAPQGIGMVVTDVCVCVAHDCFWSHNASPSQLTGVIGALHKQEAQCRILVCQAVAESAILPFSDTLHLGSLFLKTTVHLGSLLSSDAVYLGSVLSSDIVYLGNLLYSDNVYLGSLLTSGAKTRHCVNCRSCDL